MMTRGAWAAEPIIRALDAEVYRLATALTETRVTTIAGAVAVLRYAANFAHQSQWPDGFEIVLMWRVAEALEAICAGGQHV
jgi:hypothetical protein